jgi:hypothetical protein
MVMKKNSVKPGKVVYEVQYGFGPDGHENLLGIGVFSSRKLALETKNRLLKKPGFRKKKGKFWITRTVMDQVGWGDGFISSGEYFASPNENEP